MGYTLREKFVALNESEIRTDVKIKTNVKPFENNNNKPMMINLGPVLLDSVPPIPDISDPVNAAIGVSKRIAYKTPPVNKVKLRKLRRFVYRWCKKNLVPLSPDIDVSFHTWIENTNYSRRRKDELCRTWEKIKDLDPMEILKNKKFTSLKCFVKHEWYVSFKHARGIFSRSDEFKCLVGPIFKQIEKQVFSLPNFIKKIPVSDRPRIMKETFSGYKFFAAADFTSFEAHFTKDVYEAIEFTMYDYMTQFLACKTWFQYMLRNVIAGLNICLFKYFTVQIPATRQSGEMCTSLGNGFSNLMIINFVSYMKNKYIPDCFVEGDDSLVAYKHETHAPNVNDYKDLGFTIKLETSHYYNKMSFCGNIFDVDDLVVVTDPVYVVSTFGWGDMKYHGCGSKMKKTLLRAKSLSLKFQYAGCPIITALADYGLRMTKTVNIRQSYIDTLDVYHKDQLLNALKIDPCQKIEIPFKTRLLVEEIYGISVTSQLEIEKCLESKNDFEPIYCNLLVDRAHPDFLEMFSTYVMPDKKINIRPFGKTNLLYKRVLRTLFGHVPWWSG